MMDILCINRYYGWYSLTGHLEVVAGVLSTNLVGWNAKYNKTVILTEYGAGAVAGINSVRAFTRATHTGYPFRSRQWISPKPIRLNFCATHTSLSIIYESSFLRVN
jgi:hypothetical protein